MSERRRIQITSIDGGLSERLYGTNLDTYHASIGIDPDIPGNAAAASSGNYGNRTGGAITPVAYSKFSGTEITGVPYWIVTQPKFDTANSGTYVFQSNGRLSAFTNAQAMITADKAGTAFPLTTITNGNGMGCAYYNNYLYGIQYGATADVNNTAKADVWRYGGFASATSAENAAIALTKNWFTSLSLAPLTNITYPSFGNTTGSIIQMPNHPMHLHTNNALYVGDVLPITATTSNQGCLHKIQTKWGTIDGDTNDGSAYNVIDFPYGFFPSDIESYGTDLATACFQTTSANVNQGRSELFFWDTFNTETFYNRVPLPDAFCTALLNVNGSLYAFTGTSSAGFRVSKYTGGKSMESIHFFEDGMSPFAGAVDAFAQKLAFGGYVSYPSQAASVITVGTKFSNQSTAAHNAVIATAANNGMFVASVKYTQQASNSVPRVIVGWTDDSAKGLDKFSSSASVGAIWRSRVYEVGQKFAIKRVVVTLATAITSSFAVQPTIYWDDASANTVLPEFNDTNYSGKTTVAFKVPAYTSYQAFKNFFIEFVWSGTVPVGVTFPVVIDLEVQDDFESGP